jgi:beta-carotene hydroxylase
MTTLVHGNDCASELELPGLGELGFDLTETTPAQRRIALARPFAAVVLFILAACAHLWWLTPVAVFLVFVAVVAVTHDVVHGNMGLSRSQTEWALFATGALLLESGHAYRTTHLRHHAVFPEADDPEGDPARMTFWRAVFHGPIFLPRLWCWAWDKQRGNRPQRAWLLAEAGFAVGIVVTAIVVTRSTWAPLLYTALAWTGSWVYPLSTVHLPHRHYGTSPLQQTHTLRGRWIPALFLELTYHLEHHLYPQVPSHHLPELSRRLTPFLQRAGVQPRRVP